MFAAAAAAVIIIILILILIIVWGKSFTLSSPHISHQLSDATRGVVTVTSATDCLSGCFSGLGLSVSLVPAAHCDSQRPRFCYLHSRPRHHKSF